MPSEVIEKGTHGNGVMTILIASMLLTPQKKKGGKNVNRRYEMKKDVSKFGVMAGDLLRKEGFETNQIITILTREETAKILRVHPSTISRYALSGELKSFKIGSRRLFKYSDVLSFFENLVDLRCISEMKEV